RADTRPHCRSGIDRQTRRCAFSHSPGWLSDPRFRRSDKRSLGRQSRSCCQPGQAAAWTTGASTNGELAATAKGTMTPPLYIALRFLTHRKRALLLSLSGVVFGVAIFICTQAQTQGFAQHFIDSTIGSYGALVIKSRFRPRYEPLMVSSKSSNGIAPRRLYFEGITDANEIMRVSRQFSNVVSCSPVLRGTVIALAGFENATVELYG